MAWALALVAAFLFALAAALQQKGALGLPEISLQHPASLAHLAGTGPPARLSDPWAELLRKAKPAWPGARAFQRSEINKHSHCPVGMSADGSCCVVAIGGPDVRPRGRTAVSN